MQSVGSVYPANIFYEDLPPLAINKINVQDVSGCTPTFEQWDPPVNLSHMDENKRETVQQILREESASFSQTDDDIGCVKDLQMDIL